MQAEEAAPVRPQERDVQESFAELSLLTQAAQAGAPDTQAAAGGGARHKRGIKERGKRGGRSAKKKKNDVAISDTQNVNESTNGPQAGGAPMDIEYALKNVAKPQFQPKPKPKRERPPKRINEKPRPGRNPPAGRYGGGYQAPRGGRDSLLHQRMRLPMWEKKEQFLQMVRENQVVIVEGHTGSGKTTQVPQFIVEAGINGSGKVVCTQPRRVAAISVARRVAEEANCALGQEVGYSIRFEDRTSSRTILKYATDGMLLREAINDPLLRHYSVIILDEAHERTISNDILFGLMKQLIERRKDVKLIVMSATLEAEKFIEYFNNAVHLEVSGSLFPLELFYTPEPVRDYLEAAISKALEIHASKEPGDILIFLTGEQEIEDACMRISQEATKMGPDYGEMLVLPLYSVLPPQKQQRIFDPAPPARYPGGPLGRKCIVSTNISESSLTIDGIVFVIDSGFAKQKVYNPRIRVEALRITCISKASAKQRAGRACRTRPGKCYRLYTERSFEELPEQTHPEILRSNLSSMVLQMKKLGIDDLIHFDFLDPPPPESFMRALEVLNFLGAIDDDCNLTETGALMAEFPLEPQLAKCIVSSPKFSCSNEMATIAALLSVPNLFHRPKDFKREADEAKEKFAHPFRDHMTLLNVYHAYQMNHNKGWCHAHFLSHKALVAAENIRNQIVQLMRRSKLMLLSTSFDTPEYSVNIRRALVSAFFMQVAHKQPTGGYLSVTDTQPVFLHPSSTLTHKPEWVLYDEFALTHKNFIKNVTEIEGRWLPELAPRYTQHMATELPNSHTRKTLQSYLSGETDQMQS